jgi:hypothetical protein
MKKLVAWALGLIISLAVSGQDYTIGTNRESSGLPLPKVDRRTELMSIVFRLAGNPEYNQDNYKSYVKDIHDHFDQYKDHEIVSFAKQLSKLNGISFDAVEALAIYLTQPPELKPIIPLAGKIPEPRWGKENAEKFVGLLQKFYVDAKCDDFFKSQEQRYALGTERFLSVYRQMDISWFKEYYGTDPKGSLNVIVGLGNGGCNYGCKIQYPNGNEDPYAIMGSWTFDAAGEPTFNPAGYLPTLIHEFNHSFVNQLNDLNEPALRKSGQILFKPLASIMSRQAYSSWKLMENEALVRASVIRYMIKHDDGTKAWEQETVTQISNGFIWIGELVDLLGKYENARDQYPTLESFMPRIIEFYDNLAKNKKELFDRCVRIKQIEPFGDKAQNVSPLVTEMKITFSKAMVGDGYSIRYGNSGEDHFPILAEGLRYADNNTALILPLKLEPGKEYEFIMAGRYFRATDGYPLLDVGISFKTGKKP